MDPKELLRESVELACEHVRRDQQRFPPLRSSRRLFQRLKEHTCTICRATYEKRNSLNRHIRSKHVQKLKCFFCEKRFPADRNAHRATHMIKQQNYPVPEQFLQGPLDASADLHLPISETGFYRDSVTFSKDVAPIPDPFPSLNLPALFPVEEPDTSGIPRVRLPSSPIPSRCSTPLLDEQPPLVSQTSDAEVKVGNMIQTLPLETTIQAPTPVVSSMSGSEPFGRTSGVAASWSLPQAVVARKRP